MIAFAISPDDRLAATGTRNGTVRLWSTKTGRPLRQLVGHELSVPAVAFSPDSKLVATGSADFTARLWRTEDGSLVAVLVGHNNPVTTVAFDPRGDLVATGSRDRTVRIWGTEVGKPYLVLRGHEDSVNRVRFSPDGSELLSVSSDGTERVWDPKPEPRLRLVRRARAPEPGPRVALAGGKRAEARGNIVVVRDLGTGKEVRLQGHDATIRAVNFDRSGKLLATASEDHDARIWDADTGEPLQTLRGQGGAVNDANFSPDGRWVVTAGPIAAVLWRSDTGALQTYLRGHTGELTDARFIDARRIVTASRDGTVRSWVCDICGTVDELVILAKARLALTNRELTTR